MAFSKIITVLVMLGTVIALSYGAPADKETVEALQSSQPKETLKTANSIGYGYGWGYGYPYQGYGWGGHGWGGHGWGGYGWGGWGYPYGYGYGHGYYGSPYGYWW